MAYEISNLNYMIVGTYAKAFLAFWALILVAYVTLYFMKSRGHSLFIRLCNTTYWAFGVALILFAACRPFGLARDDFAYLQIFDSICPSITCGKIIQGDKDWGWYSLVGLLKYLWPDPRVMLFVTAVAVFTKIWIIFKLSRQPLLGLLVFTAVFYPIQDLTSFRVSLSLAALMVGIYLLVIRKSIAGVLALFLTGLIHKQALLSPLILLAGILRRRYATFVILAIVPICLLFVGGALQSYRVLQLYSSHPWVDFVIKQGLDAYMAASQVELYDRIRIMPYSYLPFIAIIVAFSRNVYFIDKNLYRYCGMSFLISCWLTWFFAGWQEPQARFFEYFALPTILLVGNFKSNFLPTISVFVVSLIFIVRYNVLHPILGG